MISHWKDLEPELLGIADDPETAMGIIRKAGFAAWAPPFDNSRRFWTAIGRGLSAGRELNGLGRLTEAFRALHPRHRFFSSNAGHVALAFEPKMPLHSAWDDLEFELVRCVDDPHDALFLLEEAQFYASWIPAFQTPMAFWRAIRSGIESGREVNGFERLIEVFRRIFPDNELFIGTSARSVPSTERLNPQAVMGGPHFERYRGLSVYDGRSNWPDTGIPPLRKVPAVHPITWTDLEPELIKCIDQREDAANLIRHARFGPWVPVFCNPSQFWKAVGRGIQAGRELDGAERLVEGFKDHYPGHRFFIRTHDTGTSVVSRSWVRQPHLYSRDTQHNQRLVAFLIEFYSQERLSRTLWSLIGFSWKWLPPWGAPAVFWQEVRVGLDSGREVDGWGKLEAYLAKEHPRSSRRIAGGEP